jgi:hypothetical protein
MLYTSSMLYIYIYIYSIELPTMPHFAIIGTVQSCPITPIMTTVQSVYHYRVHTCNTFGLLPLPPTVCSMWPLEPFTPSMAWQCKDQSVFMSCEQRVFFISVMEYQSTFCGNFLCGEKGSFVCITILFPKCLDEVLPAQMTMLMTWHCIEIKAKGIRQINLSWTSLKLVMGG